MTNQKPCAPRVRVKPAMSMTPEHIAKVDNYLQLSVPDKHKTGTERALKGMMGKALALKQKCLQCCGYQREEVKVCAVVTCALWPVRPYQTENEPEDSDAE